MGSHRIIGRGAEAKEVGRLCVLCVMNSGHATDTIPTKPMKS